MGGGLQRLDTALTHSKAYTKLTLWKISDEGHIRTTNFIQWFYFQLQQLYNQWQE